MCLGLVGRVVELDAARPDVAVVDIAGVRRPINIGLLDEPGQVAVGGWILVHMGFALQTVSDEEAEQALAMLDGMSTERLADSGGPGPSPTPLPEWAR